MLKQRILRAVISVLAIVAAVVVFTPGTAMAAVYQEYASLAYSSPPAYPKAVCDSVWYRHNGEARMGARGCFEKHGDEFWIDDTLADGHHVEMRAQVNLTGDGFRCYTYRHSSYSWQRCDSFASKIPEDGRLWVTIGVWEGSTQIASTSFGVEAS